MQILETQSLCSDHLRNHNCSISNLPLNLKRRKSCGLRRAFQVLFQGFSDYQINPCLGPESHTTSSNLCSIILSFLYSIHQTYCQAVSDAHRRTMKSLTERTDRLLPLAINSVQTHPKPEGYPHCFHGPLLQSLQTHAVLSHFFCCTSQSSA